MIKVVMGCTACNKKKVVVAPKAQPKKLKDIINELKNQIPKQFNKCESCD